MEEKTKVASTSTNPCARSLLPPLNLPFSSCSSPPCGFRVGDAFIADLIREDFGKKLLTVHGGIGNMGRKRASICKRDGGAFKRRLGGGSDDEEYVLGEEEEVEDGLDESLAGDATEEEFEYGESSCGSEEELDFDYDEEEEEDRNEADDVETVDLEEVDAGSVTERIGRAKRSRDLVQVDAEEELDEGWVRSRLRNAAVLDYAEDEEDDDNHDEDFLPDDGEDEDVDDEDIEPFQKRRKFKASRTKLKKKPQAGPDDYNDNDFDVECKPFFDYDVSNSKEAFIANNPIALNKRRSKIKNAACRKRWLVVSDSDSDSLIFEGQLKNKDICMRQCGENADEEFGKQRCGICLSEDQKRTVRGKLDCCAHFFCSVCIMEWSKVETRCPVCKRRFSTITKTSKLDPMYGMNKVVRVQTRDQIYQPSEGEIRQMLDPYGNIVCTECQQAVDDHLMLLCDICDSCSHTYCVGLGREVPEGNWYCDCCRSATTASSYVQNQDFSGGVPKSESLTHGYEVVEDAAHIHSNSYSQPSGSFPCLVASQRIDLNAPPTLDDDYAAMYQVTGVGGSTLSGRRAMHQRIRILLSNSRPRQMIHQNHASNVEVGGDATPQEVQQSEGSLLSLSEQNLCPPHILKIEENILND